MVKVSLSLTLRILATFLGGFLFFFFCTLTYRILVAFALLFLWQRRIFPFLTCRWRLLTGGISIFVFLITLLYSFPRFRVGTDDRVQLIYWNDAGEVRHPPLLHYLAAALLPEEEVMNIGIAFARAKHWMFPQSCVAADPSYSNDRNLIRFFDLYHRLAATGADPMSGAASQYINTMLDSHVRAAYLNTPFAPGKDMHPLVVVCPGFMGNWKCYQGLWVGLRNCCVLGIGTDDLSGVYRENEILRIFLYYIPALEHMGYRVDQDRIHLIGFGNGGTAVDCVMRNGWSSHFRSLSLISCNLVKVSPLSCRFNLIGGGQDRASNRMQRDLSRLVALGVDAEICYEQAENHYMMVNSADRVLGFLNRRLELNDDNRH